ncbi:cation efflux protein [Flagelloscypha sp. PMI_526]|nr:cation efflux protein [Flagelloscypha sp. PMI_526]
MASRTTRISILLTMDVVFFLVELIVGYAVGSLALVADSFHMLNDVISLVIALYAIKLTARDSKGRDERYSYGFHRAEILAALVNGVFLLALCFSISLEALERFFSTPEISSPKLVVIVGSLGLASNIVGLFLFHEHGHSHGPSHSHSSPATPLRIESPIGSGTVTPTPIHIRKQSSPERERRSFSRSSVSFSGLSDHPAATRATMVQTAKDMAIASSPPPSARPSLDLRPSPIEISPPSPNPDEDTSETSPLVAHHHNHDHNANNSDEDHGHSHSHGHGHGHSHGSMNMRAVLLHVFGDALGNIGVIATGLIMWLTEWSFKYYCDPVISLLITVIIFCSALPLVRSTSFILLQGVPLGIDLQELGDELRNVEGVLSIHELHVWTLSETKIIASVHVCVSNEHDFMPVAAKLNEHLHRFGIHSSTIQPEWPEYVDKSGASVRSQPSPIMESACLIACPNDQGCDPFENSCCPPPRADA